MNLRQLTQPDEPLSFAEIKSYLRVDDSTGDGDIGGMITAARLLAEVHNGRHLAQRTFELALDYFPSRVFVSQSYPTIFQPIFDGVSSAIRLPAPLVSVESFTVRKQDGSNVPLVENTDFLVDTAKEPGELLPAVGKSWPQFDLWPSSAIRIRFTSGFAATDCPENIKQGIKLLVSQWHENRVPFESIRFVAELPFSVRALFEMDRLVRL